MNEPSRKSHQPVWQAGRAAYAALVVALAASAVAFAPGCGTQCDRHPDDPPIEYRGGTTNAARDFYFSAPLSGPWLDFPPGRTYRFPHGLAGTPQHVQVLVSYAVHPLDLADEDKGADGVTQAAGNQVTYEAVTDEFVDIRNDTCSDVRVRLEAGNPIGGAPDVDAAPPSAPDAGALTTDGG